MCEPSSCFSIPCDGYPYMGNFGCGPPVINYLTRPCQDGQELASFPVIPYTGPPPVATVANLLSCNGPQRNNCHGTLWVTDFVAGTCGHCSTITDIVYYRHRLPLPVPASPSAPVLVDRIVVWLDPCSLACPACSVDATLTLTGTPTSDAATPPLGNATFRFRPTNLVSLAPNCPARLEFDLITSINGVPTQLIFDLHNSAEQNIPVSTVGKLRLRYC